MKHELPKKQLVADSFGRAAAQYDDVAVLQRQTADSLLERLDTLQLSPERIVDLGVGTGRNLSLLDQRYPDAQLIAVDIAPAMLQQARHRYAETSQDRNTPQYLTGDAEKLPLADNSIDLIFANLSLQWCDPTASFTEVTRVLRQGGVVIFCSLGPDTLHELRHSWAQVDDYPHVNSFYDQQRVTNAMDSSGMSNVVLDVEQTVLSYTSAMALMKDLKILGARNVNRTRRRGLTGKQAIRDVQQAYEVFRHDTLLPATYEVFYGHGVKACQTQDADVANELIRKSL